MLSLAVWQSPTTEPQLAAPLAPRGTPWAAPAVIERDPSSALAQGEYLQLRQRVLEHGLDALPDVAPGGGGAVPERGDVLRWRSLL